MELLIEYPGLEKTLIALKLQARESIPFACNFLPDYVKTKEDIFYFLKANVIYMNDPKGVELLQCMKTLFSSKNKHGIFGAGDCDCFTIALLACLYCKGFKNFGIVLAGRLQDAPVHIYVYAGRTIMDLTNDYLNKERSYKYKQFIPVKF